MSFADILTNSVWGRIVRAPLMLLPKQRDVRVLAGPLRGSRWIVGAQRHACWLGIYEPKLQNLIAERIRPGRVFFDIGANAGIYTLLAAQMSGSKVYAFEPLPENLFYLRQHISLNGLRNVEVIEVAISNEERLAKFASGASRSEGRLSDKGEINVPCVTLDSLILSQRVAPPDYIKMDIEGEELCALRGATYCFTEIRPELFLATHGAQLLEECCQLLRSWDYDVRSIVDNGSDRAEIHAIPRGAS